MKVYLLGSNDISETNKEVLVTIELIDNMTDMLGIKRPSILVSPFYLTTYINCGKIVSITDLKGTKHIENAEIPYNGGYFTFTEGYYFNIKNYAYGENKPCVQAYAHKNAALEKSDYVSSTYSGSLYNHYPSGLIAKKLVYVKGKLHSIKFYRNDRFNSLEGCRIYKDSYVQCDFAYDKRETLISKNWYNSNGTIYDSKVTKAYIAPKAVIEAQNVDVFTATTTLDEASEESTCISEDASDDIPPEGGSNDEAGKDLNKASNCKFKPKQEDDDEASC